MRQTNYYSIIPPPGSHTGSRRGICQRRLFGRKKHPYLLFYLLFSKRHIVQLHNYFILFLCISLFLISEYDFFLLFFKKWSTIKSTGTFRTGQRRDRDVPRSRPTGQAIFTRKEKPMKNRLLSLLLVFAMLTLAFAAILPVAAAEPEPEEIQDFGYQSSANFAVAHTTTEVRFVFTIGSLDYTKAGFVFSFESYGNVAEPEVGADGCYVIEATAAHSSIVADGKTIPAPDGRWWIAVKMINIPQDEFCGWIYVRAFVTVGTRAYPSPTIGFFRNNGFSTL